MKKNHPNLARQKRKIRIRAKIKGTALRPRVTVFRSNKHLYLQAIDDQKGVTLAASSDLKSKNVAADLSKQLLARKISTKGRSAPGGKKILFDRSGYKYHGQVKKIADELRKADLEF